MMSWVTNMEHIRIARKLDRYGPPLMGLVLFIVGMLVIVQLFK